MGELIDFNRSQKRKIEKQQLALTRLELSLRKALKQEQFMQISNKKQARANIEELRRKYLLNPNTIEMFRAVGLIADYTELLKDFNKALDV